MKKWTWQWLVLLAFFGALFSCGAWIDRQPYHIYEDVYKPDTPWKQMIWKARVEDEKKHRAWSKRQTTEDRQQTTEVGRQRSEDRGKLCRR